VLNSLENDTIINPNGYSKLDWNDSVEKLQSIYPDICEIEVYIHGKRITSLRKFSIEKNHLNDRKLIKTFDFDKNKLFRVTVDYGILSTYHSGLIEYILYNHYGKFDWFCSKINDNKKMKYGFNIFNDNIRIILVIEEILEIGGEYKNIYMIKNRIVNCIYENRKNDSKLGLIGTDHFELINMKDYSNIIL
jgi:hypothetical protein